MRKQYKSGVSQPTYPKRAKWGVKTWNGIFILGSIVWLVVGFSTMAWSQINNTTLTGTVVESSSGSPVAYANIILSRGDEQILTSSDTAGFFQFSDLPFGIYRMTISSVGYQTLIIREMAIEHQDIPELHIRLESSTLMIKEVVVQADQAVTSAARLSGGYTLTPEKVRRFPATFYDPARLATVYPGILNVNDQANNLAIRGNSPNQMNFYIHGAEIVNSNHLANAGTSTDRTTLSGGSVNMFSAQLLENTEIYTGVIPVHLMQATSGAMNYQIKHGSRSQFHFTGQAGLNGIDLAVEGPLGERWSYIANYRYSTVGLLSQLGVDFSDETILYQDLSLQASFYQNERVTWQFFAMGGDNSNTFRAKEDSLREEYKDLFDIDFKSQIGIAGANVEVSITDRFRWNTTLAASTRWDQREEASPFVPSSSADDYLKLTKYALHSGFTQDLNDTWQLDYGLNTTIWNGGLEYENERSSGIRSENSVRSALVRPYVEGRWKRDRWRINGGMAASYSALTGGVHFLPKFALIRYLSHQQKVAINTGLHRKLQPYQVLLSSDSHAVLPMMRSWKSTFTYEKNFTNSGVKSTLFYEDMDQVAATPSGFSALNTLEEYPPAMLDADGKGRNFGVEMAYQYYLSDGLFFLVSGTWFDARYQSPGKEAWINSHFNNQYIINTTIGKEFDFSTSEKQKVLGVNFQLVYTGGFWETPIDVAASRAAQRTIRTSDNLFSEQLPDVLKTYFRIYYKINHSRRYSLIGLDLSNVLNRENVSYRYFDPLQDQVVSKHQLGLIPMLSYVIRI